MALDHIPPPEAALIWQSGDKIFLSLPSPLGARPQVLTFAPTPLGLKQLLRILSERQKETLHLLGTEGAPVQYDVDKAQKPKPSPNQVASATEWLKSKGIFDE